MLTYFCGKFDFHEFYLRWKHIKKTYTMSIVYVMSQMFSCLPKLQDKLTERSGACYGRTMNTKEKAAKLLEENKETYISGACMAEELGVSRTAVWKAIGKLEEEGYRIEAEAGKGYRLAEDHDIISEATVRKYLKTEKDGEAAEWPAPVLAFKEVGSTNDVIREQALAGAPEGTVAVAASQTKGRGRKGRPFYSPIDTGVYFSILLRPDMEGFDPASITVTAAVAVAMALEKMDVEDVGIKWVNDIFVGGKKICGILTEATADLETGGIDHAVLGIGINVYEPEGGFPEGLREIAGSVFDKDRKQDGRSRLAAEVVRGFSDLYRGGDVMEEYRKRCFVPGNEVTVIKADRKIPAFAVAVDEKCRLLVRYGDGSEEALATGEVSLKMKQ